MLKYLFVTGLIFYSSFGFSAPRVPATMEFAGIKLSISEAARKQIQADVEALHRNQTYFFRKVEKVDMYFPIIERVFREENIPEDFKYLVIQESALVPDAVSTSNAVGFWQFKEGTAREVGLRVDRQIDERMNITASSHAAAKYLKKNNFFFDNWVYALLAYNTGPGGAEQHVNKKYFGAKKMDITRHSHWYVKKFLAHKIAFEEAIGQKNDFGVMLYEYTETQNKTLKDLSDQFKIDYQLMVDYNKWIKKGRIPTDKTYTATIPVSASDPVALKSLNRPEAQKEETISKPIMVFQNTYKPISEYDFKINAKYPIVKKGLISKSVKVNGIPGFIATKNDNLTTITIDYGITQKKFLKYNEMTSSDKIVPGQVYYLKSKKSKAKIHYHVVIPGESAWSISQKYGLKVKKLLAKNRLREEKNLDAGMVVWLRFIRPEDVPVEYKYSDAKNVIVKSTSPQNTYPSPTPIPETNESDLAANESTKIASASSTSTDERSDFLFEEVDNETEFLNENSYINLDTEEKDIPENSSIEQKNSHQIPEDQKTSEKTKIYHMVKSGETLFSISRMYDVTIGEIRQWNDIENLDVLTIGQRISLYQPSDTQVLNDQEITATDYKTHVVKKNDTLYGIARENGISIKELMDMNNKEDFTIHEGEVLKVRTNK